MLILPSDNLKRLQVYYGSDFPGLPTADGLSPATADGPKLRNWLDSKFTEQNGINRDRRLHFARHDQYRRGNQWISSRDGRTLREPSAEKNMLRIVLNILGPALDFRLGIIAEQRPGFRTELIRSGSAAREIAEAQQAVAEYYYYVQRAWNLFLDAMYWAQTHGTSFVHVFVDKAGGPKHDDVELVPPGDERYETLTALGYEQDEKRNIIVPLDESGDFAEPGSEPHQISEGELQSRVVLAAETLADPEARTVNGPIDPARWFVVRRVRDTKSARIQYSLPDLTGESILNSDDPAFDVVGPVGQGWQRGLPPFPSRRSRSYKEASLEHFIYFPKQEDVLPEGAWIHLVGNQVVESANELPGGVIPFARFTDGSSDPQLYPRPIVSDWIPDQSAINAIITALMSHVRIFQGGRVLARKGTLIEETYTQIVGSVIKYEGEKPDFLTPPNAGKDQWQMLEYLIKKFEDKHGWNDIARGQVSGEGSMQDVSGRALLGARELFERTFGPMVRAAAEGATEWAHIIIKYAQFIFDTPRLIPAVGRPDLAMSITRDKLGERPVVYLDPETLMPLPRALRAQMLEDQLDKQRITLDQYQQRNPFAEISNLTMGDTDQWERAKWINTIIEERVDELMMMPPEQLFSPESGLMVYWQDTPSVHKRALGLLILNDRKPWKIRKMALDRWGIYDEMERAQLDQTGQVPIPWEVLGVPPDKVQMQQPAPPQEPNAAPPQPVPAAPPQPQPATAPPPQSPVVSQSSQEAPQPLGTYGNVERAAAAQENEQY